MASLGRHVETVMLPSGPSAPALARSMVREQLAARGFDSLIPDAVLVVSEVVTNAVQHTGSETIEVALTTLEDGVRIAVADSDGDGVPVRKAVDPDAPDGRGLAIVAALASEWGIAARPPGKVVWAEVRAPR